MSHITGERPIETREKYWRPWTSKSYGVHNAFTHTQVPSVLLHKTRQQFVWYTSNLLVSMLLSEKSFNISDHVCVSR